jgi:hypothetical protein
LKIPKLLNFFILTLLISNNSLSDSYVPKYKEVINFVSYQTAIHAYFNHCNVLPDQLSDLKVKTKMCEKWKDGYIGNILDSWGREYQYRKISETLVEISSMGKDGLRETGDDIKYLISSDLWKKQLEQKAED